jgi:hypothetical protein
VASSAIDHPSGRVIFFSSSFSGRIRGGFNKHARGTCKGHEVDMKGNMKGNMQGT